MLKKSLVVAVAALGLATIMASLSSAQGKKETVRQELNEHPRIHAAIRELEEAIKYMEAAPHNFGGHKAKAIADSRAALAQLRLAVQYRLNQENKPR
jgi:type II secretory pathway component PulJ